MADALYASNSGRIVCRQHIGGYGQSILQRTPDVRSFITPLDAWTRVTAADMAEWLRDIGEPMTCEECR